MKKFLLATATLVATVIPAAAADMALKAPPLAPPPFNWTGFYIGANGGYSWGTANTTVTGLFPVGTGVPIDVSPDGGFGGGQIGFNWQPVGSPWLLGFETDFQGSGETGDPPCTAPTCVPNASVTVFIHDFGTVRGRIGVAADHWLFYATGGFAYADVSRQVFQLGYVSYGDTQWLPGWTVGGGIEYAFDMHWSIKVEYLYMDFGTSSVTLAASGPLGPAPLGPIGISTLWIDNAVRGGINYRF